MHRKIRTSIRTSAQASIEKLAQLHLRAIEIGERAQQLSGDAYRKAFAFADGKLQGTRLEGRTKLVGLAAASVLATGFVGGTAAIVDSDSASPAQPAVVAADARADAAERADRADRAAVPAEAQTGEAQTGEAQTGEAQTGEAQAAQGQAAEAQTAEAQAAEQAAAEKAAAEKAAAEKAAAESQKAPDWVEPMPGAEVTSCYGPRWGTEHRGVDFAAPAGTEIRAVGAGRVVGAGWLYTGYGISVVIDHGDGYLTHYAHASKVLVKEGQNVKPGQVIAHEGSTGDSTGPHLHFEVHKGMWNQVNPDGWLADRGIKVGC